MSEQPLPAAIRAACLLLVRIYVNYFSSFKLMSCRFIPSCSCYAQELFQSFPLHVALRETAMRLLRCHPFSGYGFDPVPQNCRTTQSVSSCCDKGQIE